MESDLHLPTAEGASCHSGYFATTIREAARGVEKGLETMRAAVCESLEDSKMNTGRIVKRSRFAVENGIDETTHTIKRHPLSSLAIAFAIGSIAGFLSFRLTNK